MDPYNAPRHFTPYTQEFFQDNVIVFVRAVYGSGSPQFEVTGLKSAKGALHVELGVYADQVGTADMAEWRLLLDVKKSDLPDCGDLDRYCDRITVLI